MSHERVKNLTEGNPLKLILNFTLPLLLGNLFQQTYNIVDSAIVGQTLGANALGSVGVSSSVQFLVLGFVTGSMTGFAIPVAAAFGAKKESEMRRYVYNGAVWAAIIAVILTSVTAILTPSILRLLKTPGELYEDAYAYLLTIFLGLPATVLYNFLSSVLRAVGDSRTPFLFLALSSLLNIGLDLFCIINLGMGVFGAAFATVISQAVSGILCVILVVRKFSILHIRKEERIYSGAMSRRVLNMGLPMGLQFSITAIGSMVMQTANNSLGTVYVSAYAAGLKIKQFAMSPFDALGAAISTYISQNFGAGKMERIEHGIRIGEKIAVLYGIGIGIVLIFFGRDLSLIFMNGDAVDVLNASAQYLRTLGFFYWLLGILIVTRSSVQGIGWSRQAVLAGVIEMFARTVVSVFLVKKLGYAAICMADPTAWGTATLYLIPTLKAALHWADNEILHHSSNY